MAKIARNAMFKKMLSRSTETSTDCLLRMIFQQIGLMQDRVRTLKLDKFPLSTDAKDDPMQVISLPAFEVPVSMWEVIFGDWDHATDLWWVLRYCDDYKVREARAELGKIMQPLNVFANAVRRFNLHDLFAHD